MYQPHPSHRIKAYTGDPGRPTVFCGVCGKEDVEEAIKEPCPGKFIVDRVDTKTEPN